jgi:endonuclease/exonuclease/phosphatase family metal-dependent hydrolase
MKKLILAILLLSISKLTTAEPLKIASWNIAWLSSHGFNKRVGVDYKQLAKYASQLDADVIALQ